MAIFKPYKITSDQLTTFPIVEGQLIYTTDTHKNYLDIDSSNRILIGSEAIVDIDYENGFLTYTDANGMSGLVELKTAGAQPNWEENDPTSASYIQGRTHWVETGETLEIIYEGTPTFSSAPSYIQSAGVAYITDILNESTQKFLTGYITINGEKYGFIAVDGWYDAVTDENKIIIENATFFVRIHTTMREVPYYQLELCSTEDLTGISVVIEGISLNESVHTLDEKFIPDTIARVEDIISSDWNQNDSSALDFIQNRTHYTEPYEYAGPVTQNFNFSSTSNTPYLYKSRYLLSETGLLLRSITSGVVTINETSYSFNSGKKNSFMIGTAQVYLENEYETIDSGAAYHSRLIMFSTEDLSEISYSLTDLKGEHIHPLDKKFLPPLNETFLEVVFEQVDSTTFTSSLSAHEIYTLSQEGTKPIYGHFKGSEQRFWVSKIDKENMIFYFSGLTGNDDNVACIIKLTENDNNATLLKFPLYEPNVYYFDNFTTAIANYLDYLTFNDGTYFSSSLQATDNPLVKIYRGDDGRIKVLLLDDCEVTEQVNITHDIDLILNGCNINFSKAGKLYFQAGTNCTIEATNSTLSATVNVTDNTSIYSIIIGKGKSLHINGGNFIVNGEMTKMCGAITFGDTSQENSIKNATISVTNTSSALATNVVGILNQTGIAKTKVIDCKVTVICASENCTTRAIHNDDAGGHLECINTTVEVINNATPNGIKIIGGITADPDTTTIIDNCSISIDHPSLNGEPAGGGIAVYGGMGGSSGLIQIKNSSLYGIAEGVFTSESFQTSIDSSSVIGYISALVTLGKLFLNDCSLTNGYYSGVYDQSNATIRSAIEASEGTTDYTVYMDNCIIEESGYKSIISDETVQLFISNSNYSKSADQLCENAGNVYLGCGNNFGADIFTAPERVFSTNNTYRKLLDKTTCEGEDFNALASYINNQPVIPAATTEDEGKFLRFINGQIVWTSVPSAEEASF